MQPCLGHTLGHHWGVSAKPRTVLLRPLFSHPSVCPSVRPSIRLPSLHLSPISPSSHPFILCTHPPVCRFICLSACVRLSVQPSIHLPVQLYRRHSARLLGASLCWALGMYREAGSWSQGNWFFWKGLFRTVPFIREKSPGELSVVWSSMWRHRKVPRACGLGAVGRVIQVHSVQPRGSFA